MASTALAINCDRTSNGPHLYYPNPRGPGGTGVAEDWVMDNFGCDPLGPHAMLDTAENVANKHGIAHRASSTRWCCAAKSSTATRWPTTRPFCKRFMTLPFDVPTPNFRKSAGTLEGDEGVSRSTPEGLAKLEPVAEGGTRHLRRPDPSGRRQRRDHRHHRRARARAVAATRRSRCACTASGWRAPRWRTCPRPRCRRRSARSTQAGRSIAQMAAIKTHNPFAVNDLYFARRPASTRWRMNNYGCSLVWGHPQAPMGTRSIIELIEELAIRGGGYGLFTGCAAGDTAMAVVHRSRRRLGTPQRGARRCSCTNGSTITPGARPSGWRSVFPGSDLSYAALAQRVDRYAARTGCRGCRSDRRLRRVPGPEQPAGDRAAVRLRQAGRDVHAAELAAGRARAPADPGRLRAVGAVRRAAVRRTDRHPARSARRNRAGQRRAGRRGLGRLRRIPVARAAACHARRVARRGGRRRPAARRC